MIVGIGTDIVEIERIKRIVNRYGQRFLRRVFTAGEISYCYLRTDPYPGLAARFAAKEAVFKSLGHGLTGSKWTDVELIRSGDSAPQIVINGNLKTIALELKVSKVLISISHDGGRAVAFAVAIQG